MSRFSGARNEGIAILKMKVGFIRMYDQQFLLEEVIVSSIATSLERNFHKVLMKQLQKLSDLVKRINKPCSTTLAGLLTGPALFLGL